VPIAVGESLYSLGQFKEYLQAGACSIVQADVARIGGITPWLKVSGLRVENGFAHAPSGVGLGIDWDWAAIAAHTVAAPVIVDA